MILIPNGLEDYIDVLDGKIVATKPIPENLLEIFQEFKAEFENLDDDLSGLLQK
jgi:hypothetical protein